MMNRRAGDFGPAVRGRFAAATITSSAVRSTAGPPFDVESKAV
jgi:hypothetical protein